MGHALAAWRSWVGCYPINQNVAGSILGQGTYLDCAFDPWSGCVREAANWCFSLPVLSRCPLPLSLKINKPNLGWGLRNNWAAHEAYARSTCTLGGWAVEAGSAASSCQSRKTTGHWSWWCSDLPTGVFSPRLWGGTSGFWKSSVSLSITATCLPVIWCIYR